MACRCLLARVGLLSFSLSLLCLAPPLAAEPLDVELSSDAATGGAIPQFRISQDGGRVAFLTSTEPRGVLSVPIEGGTPATLTPLGTEAPALVDAAPDGSRVLMTARAPGSLSEIFSAPFAGGEVTKLNQTLAPGVSAFPGPITPDSTRVVYGTRTDCVVLPSSDVSCPVELFVAPLEGGASTPLESAGPAARRTARSDAGVLDQPRRRDGRQRDVRAPAGGRERGPGSGRALQHAARGWHADRPPRGGLVQRAVPIHQRRPARRLRPGRGAAQRERLRRPRGEAQSRPGSTWLLPLDFSITPDGSRVVYGANRGAGHSASSTACSRSVG